MSHSDHFYIRYGKAVVMYSNHLDDVDAIDTIHINNSINNSLARIKVVPTGRFGRPGYAQFTYSGSSTGNADEGKYIAPYVITTDSRAKDLWKKSQALYRQINLIDKQALDKNHSGGATMALAPVSGEFLRFGADNTGRGRGSLSFLEALCALVTTLTNLKPALYGNYGGQWKNSCVIPDLPLKETIAFIRVIERLQINSSSSNLLEGKIDEKGKPLRPKIFRGNFPNPPLSTALGPIALFGAIGEVVKDATSSELASNVLESLKGTTLYLVSYGYAKPFSCNHHVIDLAKKSRLKTIVDSIYNSRLYKGRRGSSNNVKLDYMHFDLIAARFLQLFNRPSFIDFLSIRSEYSNNLELIFKTYFSKMEKIDQAVIESAKALGAWINSVAYFAAKQEATRSGGTIDYDILYSQKAKLLVSIESSIHATKTGDAIANILTIAGRLSKQDAPVESTLFLGQALSGELELSVAKNLLIAFSRLKSKKVQQEEITEDEIEEDDLQLDEDLSNE